MSDADRPRPMPIADADSAPYWDAVAGGQLKIQRCVNCGAAQHYPRPQCLRCRGEVGWVEAAGTGTVYSFTVIRQNHGRPWRDMLPYVVALVDLDEGARMMTNIVGSPPEAVEVGARVRVRFEDGLPMFELVPDG